MLNDKVHVQASPASHAYAKAVSSGTKTSEFWLSVFAIVVMPAADALIESGRFALESSGALWGAAAGALVAGAYAIGRSIIKAKVIAAATSSPAEEDRRRLLELAEQSFRRANEVLSPAPMPTIPGGAIRPPGDVRDN